MNMQYRINPALIAQAKMLRELERMRKMIVGSTTQNKTSTETQTSTHQQDGMFDHQFGSGWRDEGDYREGFKKQYGRYRN